MRVEVSPRQAQIVAGQPQAVVVTVTNTSPVIAGYGIRVLGADPSWVEIDDPQLSLFPDESGTVTVTVTVPAGIPAGVRRVAVQVREQTPPAENAIVDVDLTVPETEQVALRLDPLVVTAGKRGHFTVMVENSGNTTVHRVPAGDDPENDVTFTFRPDRVSLAPGEHATLDMQVQARRPVLGAPLVRMLGLHLKPLTTTSGVEDEPEPLAAGTFIQRPALSRGTIVLAGLLAAITVFALVIAVALTQVADTSTANRDLALQVAAAAGGGAGTGTSGLSGHARLLTDGANLVGASVGVYAVDDTAQPLATTATDDTGAYAFRDLAAGDYKIKFEGASFVQVWYPAAADPADAGTVTLAAGQQRADVDVLLGGVPATISGTVSGADVVGATLTLRTVPAPTAAPAPRSATSAARARTSTTPASVVTSAPVGADGKYLLADVPSPNIYEVVVSKRGYAAGTRTVRVAAGEVRTSVDLELRTGDGSIRGLVTDGTTGQADTTITAVGGGVRTSAVSGEDGTFMLPNLPTPAPYTITATHPGFAPTIMNLALAAKQQLDDVVISLDVAAGTMEGDVFVTDTDPPRPAAEVLVTVGNGPSTVTAQTTADGHWRLDGLPAPATYSVTFSHAGLTTQIVSVALDASSRATLRAAPIEPQTTVDEAGDIQAYLGPSSASVGGVVRRCKPGDVVSRARCTTEAATDATVTLTRGAVTYRVPTSAGGDGRGKGYWHMSNVPAGVYTFTVSGRGATTPVSSVVSLPDDAEELQRVTLPAPTTITGQLRFDVVCQQDVSAYVVAAYPAGDDTSPPIATAHPTGSRLRFRFADVPAGNYVFVVRYTAYGAMIGSTRQYVRRSHDNEVSVTVQRCE